MTELVSIITPIHNAQNTLLETIESVQAQTHTNWELFLIDNLSTDQSLQLAQEAAAKDKRIVVLEYRDQPSSGATRNIGIEAAKGRYIAFLDADDTWHRTKLEEQMQYMQDQSLDFCWTAYTVKTPENTYMRALSPHHHYQDLLMKRATIGCLTAVYDTKRLGKQFMPTIKKRQDFVFFCQLLKTIEKNGYKAGGLNKILATYRVLPDSLSANKADAARYQWLAMRDCLHIPLLPRTFYFISYFLQGMNDKIQSKKPTGQHPS